MELENVNNIISEGGIKFIRADIEDTNGISKGVTLTANHFLKGINKGIPYNTRVNTATAADEYAPNTGQEPIGDAYMYADITTFKLLPWVKHTASVLVDAKSHDTKDDMLEISTRAICKRVLNKLERIGLKIYGAFEYEFYTIDPKTRCPAFENVSVYSSFSTPKCNDLITDIMLNMSHLDLEAERFIIESGVSQFEITYNPAYGITCADNAFRFRHLVKEISLQHDVLSTFMSKPFAEHSGSSGHFNVSLWNTDGVNMFYDPSKQTGLSDIGEYWIAGLQHHAKALMAFAAPTPNCYSRFGKGSSVPVNTKWGFDDRTCCYRIKNGDTANTYIEDRRPGSAINPYLYLAASVIAGMDGIERKLKLRPDDGSFILPSTLSEAVNCLKNDEIMVKSLGKKLIDCFSGIKNAEWKNQKNLNLNFRYLNI